MWSAEAALLRPVTQSGSSSIPLPARCCTLTPAARGQGGRHGHRWNGEPGNVGLCPLSEKIEQGKQMKNKSPLDRVLSVTSARLDSPLPQTYFVSVSDEEPQLAQSSVSSRQPRARAREFVRNQPRSLRLLLLLLLRLQLDDCLQRCAHAVRRHRRS